MGLLALGSLGMKCLVFPFKAKSEMSIETDPRFMFDALSCSRIDDFRTTIGQSQSSYHPHLIQVFLGQVSMIHTKNFPTLP